MRITRNFLTLVTSLCLAGVGWYGWRWLRCMDRLSSFYPTQAHAVAAGAVERGWVPTTLPTEATDIHEVHNLDTNEVWLRFTLPPDSARQFVTSLRRLSPEEVASLTVRASCDGGWWFEGLIEQQPANDAALYAEVYAGGSVDRPGRVFVALDRTTPTVYYWSSDFLLHTPAPGTADGS